MLKTVQIRRCQGLEKVGDMYWLCATPSKYHFINCVSKNDSFVLKRDSAMWKNKVLLLFLQLSIG